jgi:hypothetical protein
VEVAVMPEQLGFLKQASHSIGGHILLALIFISAPLFVAFLWLDIDEGRFTLLRTLYLAVISSIAGVIFAVGLWYAVTSSLVEKKRERD